MDTLLMNSLLYFSSGSEPPLVRLGFAYDHVATCIRHSTDVVVSLEEIARRLSYFWRKYKLVKELCEVFGCYFDSSTLKVVGTDEVWAEVDSLVPGNLSISGCIKGMAWTRTENENVCIAWGLVHNHPSVSGTGEDFWRAVSDRFHSMDGVTLGRGLDHLANRFFEIRDAIAYFVDLEHLIRIQRPMFITDAERSRAACKLYKSHEHKDFEFMSCMHVIES
ncbi:hypothetical protein FRX31_012551 [Thalictrum thalictroides]|uniref:Myb/SANT-like domain-containing protein n=1 Tax=Thalictrum thalictroides TaxID=46969 RepID=A0A7J6WLK8_THATH|nr:hypothetical protein FRX31_012551 [Thalictrum thalictroides]